MHGSFYPPTFFKMCSIPVISLRYTHLRPLHLEMPALHISIPVSQGTHTSRRQGPVQVRCKCFAAPSTKRCRLIWFLHPETPAGLSDSLGRRECGGTDIPTSEVRSEASAWLLKTLICAGPPLGETCDSSDLSSCETFTSVLRERRMRGHVWREKRRGTTGKIQVAKAAAPVMPPGAEMNRPAEPFPSF